MRVSRETVDTRMSAFKDACARSGLKVTHQRMEVFRAVASTEEHPDVESIHRAVRKRVPTISPDTVYRNLKLLNDHGLVSIVGTSHERLRFDANMEGHHHFACVRCGIIRDFHSDLPGPSHVPPEAKAFGEALSMNLEVKGICIRCTSQSKAR